MAYGSEVDAHGGSYLAIYGANQGLDDTYSQTLPTVNGICYRFSFWLNNLDGQNSSYFDVSWGDLPVLHIDETSPIFGWTEFSFIETATGPTTISFAGRNAPSFIALDDVSVIQCDVEKPVASCIPTTNPSGGNVPGGNSKSGQNSDGFYQLLAIDNCDSHPALFVADSGSGFVAGPFISGDKVKLIQAPGVTPNAKPMAGEIVAQIQLKGDALIYAVDASGNISTRVSCLLSHNSR